MHSLTEENVSKYSRQGIGRQGTGSFLGACWHVHQTDRERRGLPARPCNCSSANWMRPKEDGKVAAITARELHICLSSVRISYLYSAATQLSAIYNIQINKKL